MITDINGHGIASEDKKAEEVEQKAVPENAEQKPPQLVPTGLLVYNFIRHAIDMTMLEANLAQMRMQMKQQQMIVPPPEAEMMEKHHGLLVGNVKIMSDEINVRMASIDAARAAEYLAEIAKQTDDQKEEN